MLTAYGNKMAAVALDGGRDLLSSGAILQRLTITYPHSRLPWSPTPTRIIAPLHSIADFTFRIVSVALTLGRGICSVHTWLWRFPSVPALCLPSHFSPLEMSFSPLIFMTNRLSWLYYSTPVYWIFGASVWSTNPERLCGLPAMYFLLQRGKPCSCLVDM